MKHQNDVIIMVEVIILELKRVTIRIPIDVWKKIKKEAQENNRSLNAEIINKIK